MVSGQYSRRDWIRREAWPGREQQRTGLISLEVVGDTKVIQIKF